jgi:putative addiction module component (TIGR02574 family)
LKAVATAPGSVLSAPLLPPSGFDALSVEEQIDYVQSLWDHIAARPEQVPIPEWHREILTERLKRYQADQNKGKSWEEFE